MIIGSVNSTLSTKSPRFLTKKRILLQSLLQNTHPFYLTSELYFARSIIVRQHSFYAKKPNDSAISQTDQQRTSIQRKQTSQNYDNPVGYHSWNNSCRCRNIEKLRNCIKYADHDPAFGVLCNGRIGKCESMALSFMQGPFRKIVSGVKISEALPQLWD